MNIWRNTIIVTGLVYTLGTAAMSWGQKPPSNDISDGLSGNTGGGTGALAVTTSTSNTAYGFLALTNNTRGISNTAIGQEALQYNISGGGNMASGVRALRENIVGHYNTATGSLALHENKIGSFNTATGTAALYFNTSGNRNTASGLGALYSNTVGLYNTAHGLNALFRNTFGSFNTALGGIALFNATGFRNIALGYNAGSSLTSGNDNIYLGNTGAEESNTLRLGQVQNRTFIAGIAGRPISGSQVLINSSGQLGILGSSARYKEDIQPMGTRSQKVQQLRPVTFRYKQDSEGPIQYGLIAEEVATVYPELVTRGTNGEIESVQYHELIPMLLNEVQHQQKKLDMQTQQLTELKAQNARLEAALVQQNAALAARLEQLEQGVRGMTTVSTR